MNKPLACLIGCASRGSFASPASRPSAQPRGPGSRASATTPIRAAAPRRARPSPARSPRPRPAARSTASIRAASARSPSPSRSPSIARTDFSGQTASNTNGITINDSATATPGTMSRPSRPLDHRRADRPAGQSGHPFPDRRLAHPRRFGHPGLQRGGAQRLRRPVRPDHRVGAVHQQQRHRQ